MEGLEDEAQLVAAQTGQRVFVESRVVAAVEREPPAIGPVESGDQVEQRRLADAGFADDGDVFARLQAQRDVPQDDAAIELAREVFDFKHEGVRAACLRPVPLSKQDRLCGPMPVAYLDSEDYCTEPVSGVSDFC